MIEKIFHLAKNIFTRININVKILAINKFKLPILAGTMFLAAHTANSQNLVIQDAKQDTFEKTITVPPKGTDEKMLLMLAPPPQVEIAGEIKTAKIVVDLNKNVLYTYDNTGMPEMAYLVASGKASTPTDTGIRVVSNIETYPYRTASPKTKRYKNPRDYGPKALILRTVDPKTGKTSPTGEFIHGNNNPSSLGKYASKGCIRMDNEVIKLIAKQVEKGDIVIIKRDN